MRALKTYLEELAATPGNTIGMGNPGQIDGDTLTEPIEGTAKCIRQREKKKRKKIKESLFDSDLVTSDLSIIKDIKKLSKSKLGSQSSNTLTSIIDSLIEYGEKYSAEEARDLDIDISKNVVMYSFDSNYFGKYAPSKYSFICQPTKVDVGYAVINIIDKPEYEWDWINRRESWGRQFDWKKIVNWLDKYYHNYVLEFIVLPESISEELIKILTDVVK